MSVTKTDQVLTMLREGGPFGVLHSQFVAAGITRFSARMKELRDAGHVIETKCVDRRSGAWKSTLKHDAAKNLNPSPDVEPRPIFQSEMFPDRALNLEDVA
jgi:hypothetical protein